MQYVCVPWYAPRDLVQLQLVLLMDSLSVYTLLYQCTFEKAIQMNICQQKDWMTGKQSYDICSKEKNCKQKKMQLKKSKPAISCLTAEALRYVWCPEKNVSLKRKYRESVYCKKWKGILVNYPTIGHPAQRKSIELLYGIPSKARKH